MEIYIALLRGINVSGQKKIKMAELREALEGTLLKNVETYIQSGNIVFKSDEIDGKKLQDYIINVISERFGFHVPTLVLTRRQIEAILNANPFVALSEERNLYFVLLHEPAATEYVEVFNKEHFVNEDFQITDACVYLNCKKGYGKAKLDNNLLERKLKVKATTRNLKTMNKLLEMTED